MKSAFDLNHQNKGVDYKIVVALERLSEAFRVLLWEEAKKTGLSPIQIQILIFLHYHVSTPNTPTYLAQEFNITKATITDSLRMLSDKKLISKSRDPEDARRYHLQLTPRGKKIAQDTASFSNDLLQAVNQLPDATKEKMFEGLYEVMKSLSLASVITVPRMCSNCRFLEERQGQYHCQFLKVSLSHSQFRVDCPEFESVA